MKGPLNDHKFPPKSTGHMGSLKDAKNKNGYKGTQKDAKDKWIITKGSLKNP